MQGTAILLALAASTTASAVAQSTFLLQRESPATIGNSLQFRFTGVTQPLLLLLASPSAAATPLPGSISVSPLAIGPTLMLFPEVVANATGVTTPISIPNTPLLAGMILQWQAAGIPGTTTLIGSLSKRVATQFGLPGQPTLLPRTAQGKAWAATIHRPDPSGGPGTWLIAGGAIRPTIEQQPLDTSEVFDPSTLELVRGPRLPDDVYGMTTTELVDGRTLLVGGVTTVPASGTPPLQDATAGAVLYDPASNTFAAVAPMSTPRFVHAATRLPDGRVLVVGGSASANLAAPLPLATTELFDPITQTWSAGPALPTPWWWGAVSTLPNGEVLLHGGLALTPAGIAPASPCQRLVSASNGALQWLAGPSMITPRAVHDQGTLALVDGRLLVAGGCIATFMFGLPVLLSTADTEIYDPQLGGWQPSQPAPTPFFSGSTVQLPSGLVVAAGGLTGSLSGGPTPSSPLAAVMGWDPTTTTWQLMSTMRQARVLPSAVITPDGLLTFVGGQSVAGPGAGNHDIETLRQ